MLQPRLARESEHRALAAKCGPVFQRVPRSPLRTAGRKAQPQAISNPNSER